MFLNSFIFIFESTKNDQEISNFKTPPLFQENKDDEQQSGQPNFHVSYSPLSQYSISLFLLFLEVSY